jgi:hypothetical protein
MMILDFNLTILLVLAVTYLGFDPLTGVSAGSGPDLNCSRSLQRAPLSEVAENFRFWRQAKFFGQDLALDPTVHALRRFNVKDVLLLHFVGASGTGKTYLATLVQRSFFKIHPERRFLFAFTPSNEEAQFELLNMHDACGVAYCDLLEADTEASARTLLEQTLDRAFITREDESITVHILLDNFNKCKGPCEKLMSKVVSEKRYRSPLTNRIYPLVNTVILVTSDLTEEGLKLAPGDDKAAALERVLASVRNTWGERSLWNDRGFLVPFLPYNVHELMEITKLTIADVQREIHERIKMELHDEAKRRDLPWGSKVEWLGRFKFPVGEMARLIDKVQLEVDHQNARAFERVKGWLLQASRRPVPVEARIVNNRPVLSDMSSENPLKQAWNILQKPRHVKYYQDVVFKVVDNEHQVIIEIEDMDAAEPGSSFRSEL